MAPNQKSHVLSSFIHWSLLSVFIGGVASQYNQKLTTIAPTATSWYPWGADAGGVPLDANGNPDPNAGITVRSNPPSGTVTITTTSLEVTTAAGGAVGTATHTGTTTTDIQGRSIPTLVYNCEFMPFICRNIQNHINNKGDYKFDAKGLMELHVDINDPGPKDKKRADFRRKETCQKASSPWKKGGFPKKCASVKADLGISEVSSNLFPNLDAVSMDKMPQVVKGPPDPADPNKTLFSGLLWTCDEFPSASWVEGGRGLSNRGVDVEVVCAPMASACTTRGKIYEAIIKAFNFNAGFKFTRNPSEQNWQSSALTGLRSAVEAAHRIDGAAEGTNSGHPNDQYVGVFFLSTTKLASPTTSRAWVIDHVGATRPYSQRSLPTSKPGKKKKRNIDAFPTWAANPLLVVGNASVVEREVELPQPASASIITTSRPLPIAKETPKPLWRRRDVQTGADPVPRGVYRLRGRDVSASQVQNAQNIITAATRENQASNARRLAHPRVNHNLGGKGPAETTAIDDTVPVPNKNDYRSINETIREAAAIVAEYEARNGLMEYTWPLSGGRSSANSTGNNSTAGIKRATGAEGDSSYWYANIEPKGKSPFNPAGASYVVYKNVVTDCGAKGDGETDDTEAIQLCISAQNRCGGDSLSCASTSVMPLVLFFPSGNYLVSSNIEMYFQTLIIGDPLDRPRIIAAKSFQGLGVLSSDYYIPGAGGDSWYINQSNFFRQVRNIIIDIRNCPDNPPNTPAPGPAGLHWQVAQATSLQNVDIYMREGSRGHVGTFMENGSGGLITGVAFHGGFIGLRAGNQQFTIKNLTFDKCRIAVQAIWDWTFLWTHLKITGADIGIDLINQDLKNTQSPQQTFAYLLLDSEISAGTGIRSNPFMNTDGYAQITLDNVDFAGCETAIKETTGAAILAGSPKVDSWMWGIVASQESPTGRQVRGEAAKPVRSKPPGLLGGPNGGYFDKTKPQYENVPASSFRNALTSGCKGDGAADDTECLRTLFGAPGYVFLPAGVYRVTDTIKITSGIKIVGEAWSAITASGDKFKDVTKPRVMIQVGDKGQTGDVEISDILFQVDGPMAGAVLVEWNMLSSSPGSAGMWDSHFRVGGNAGSNLQAKDCPQLSGTINPDCIAVNLMMHITPFASGYFENVWGWTADHDLEELAGTRIDIYTGRGILIESINPTWLYATGFEHAVMYQYMVHGANNLFMGLIQTESPYFQSFPPAPEPFDKSVGLFKGDPSFSKCNPSRENSCMAWGLMIEESSNVLVYGAGLYSWFQKYNQHCLNNFDCQTDMVHLSRDKNIYIYNLATVGTVNMITSPGAKLNGLVHQSPHSNVSSINGWLGDADGSDADGNEPGATITLDSTIWLWPATQEDQRGTMTWACTPPCVFELPPITYPPLQPPATTTTWDGVPYTITPPAVVNGTVGWGRVTYNASTVVTVTPTPNATAIIVPPWPCGDQCDGHTASFPPIPLPIPTPGDMPCWANCDPQEPEHPPVLIGPGPPPGPPPPGSDDDDDDHGIIPILPGCTLITCPEGCFGPDCVEGTDCRGLDCIKGGDCIGPKCTRGGDCEGPHCVQGGGCQGDSCDHGGGCKGDDCTEGGGCTGPKCTKGGDCEGAKCKKGGGCEGSGCHDGGCTGPCGGDDGGCHGSDCGPCEGPNCGTGGCTGPDCEECTGPDCEEEDDDDDDDDDEDDVEECRPDGLNEEFPNIDTPDADGNTVSGGTGSGSGAGGNVGQGGVNGSGVGCLDTNGVLYECGTDHDEGGDNGGGGGGGGGGSSPTDLPTLTGTPWPTGPDYTGTECASYSTTELCNGSGGKSGCQTHTLCMPTTSHLPTWGTHGKATCTGESEICLSTTTFTRCGRKGRDIDPEATATANGLLPVDSNIPAMFLTAPGPSATPTPAPEPRLVLESIRVVEVRQPESSAVPIPPAPEVPAPLNMNMTENAAVANGLFALERRQGDCDSFISCAVCAKVEKYPCLFATVSAEMGAIRGINLEAVVFEDDIEVCRASTHCGILDDISQCSGYDNYDCGGGNRMDWDQNFIRYYSKKYDRTIPLYVENDGGTIYEPCLEKIALREVPMLCAKDVWSVQDGPCQGRSRRGLGRMRIQDISGNITVEGQL